MGVIFLGLLVASAAVAAMVVVGEYGGLAKIVVVALVGISAYMQFAPEAQEQVHFLVPLFMQLGVVGWYYFASQFE